MANIYDTANQLERELRETEQFQALKGSFDRLKENEEAYNLFKEFQSLQQALQQKMMTGEEMTEEEAKKAQELSQKIQQDAIVSELMQKEQAFSLVANDLNRIIMGPVRDLYEA
jgi:cell fate (sporulation/competence/biofilm development) regulator YlbF (YheA/YmcA/DUF963 family)